MVEVLWLSSLTVTLSFSHVCLAQAPFSLYLICGPVDRQRSLLISLREDCAHPCHMYAASRSRLVHRSPCLSVAVSASGLHPVCFTYLALPLSFVEYGQTPGRGFRSYWRPDGSNSISHYSLDHAPGPKSHCHVYDSWASTLPPRIGRALLVGWVLANHRLEACRCHGLVVNSTTSFAAQCEAEAWLQANDISRTTLPL